MTTPAGNAVTAPTRSGGEYAIEARSLYRFFRAGDEETLALQQVGLGARAGAYPRKLSGGEAARAALAVALVGNPAMVLADEPTGELDTATEAVVPALLVAAARSGIAVVVASHSAAVAAAADRIVRLDDARVVA